MTFEKGQKYELVASPLTEDTQGCERNGAQGLPVFATSEYDVGYCRPGSAHMGAECVVTHPGCPAMSTTRFSMQASYNALPTEPGAATAATLRLAFSSPECTELNCNVGVPVVVRW